MNAIKEDLWAKAIFKLLDQIKVGRIDMKGPDGFEKSFGNDLSRTTEPALINIKNWKMFRSIILRGDIAFGETYIEGQWDTPDLNHLLWVIGQNRQPLNTAIRGFKFANILNRLRHLLNKNTKNQARDNIEAHYDLGNDFYRLWLDQSMTYSSAIRDEEKGNDSDILEKLGAVDANDTVIFHSTDGVGVKNDLIKNTPWLLFHAMIHNDEMLDSFRDWHHGLDTHQFDQPVRNFLTMSGAKGAKSFSNNTLSGDAYTEMIVQELLGKRNLVIRRDLLSPKDLKYVDERLIPAVKGFADMMREEIKGKLIVVRGT